MSLAGFFSRNKHSECEGFLQRADMAKAAQEAMERAEKEGGSLALMLVEVDHFEQLRAERGEVAGDRVLNDVGGELKSLCGLASSVARLRSQEFAVLLRGRSAAELSAFAEQVRANTQARIAATQSAAITVSVGVGMFYPGEKSWKQMLSRADVALFCAKSSGSHSAMDTGVRRPATERRGQSIRIAA